MTGVQQVTMWQGALRPIACVECGKPLDRGFAIDGFAHCGNPCGIDIIALAAKQWSVLAPDSR